MFNVRPLMIASLALSTTALACTENAQPAASSTNVQAQALATDGGDGGGRGPRHPHGPPPPAFDACATKAAGDACTVAFHDKTLAGTCTAPPAGAPDTRVFCLPKDMPPPGGPHGGPHGPPPAEAFTACDGKAAAATCSVTLGDHTMNGTCLAPPPDSGETRLACAPPHHGPGGPGGPPPPR